MTTLVAWLWQGLALAAVTAVTLRLVRRLSAATRHAAWWTTFVGVLALPLLPWALTGVGPASSFAPVQRDHAVVASLLTVPPAPAWATAALLYAWLGWVLLRLLGLVRGVSRVASLKRNARPFSSRSLRRLPLWRQARLGGRPARLCVSDEVTVPCALGLGRATILLPRRLVTALDADTLDQVVLHEYAHLERRDDWARLAQALIEAVAGAHPAIRWIGRRIDVEREAVCDDVVAARTGRPRDYAHCLAAVAHLASGSTVRQADVPSIALGVARSPSALRQRVARLVDTTRVASITPSWSWLAASAAALLVAAVTAAQAPPLLQFRGSPPPLPLIAADVAPLTRSSLGSGFSLVMEPRSMSGPAEPAGFVAAKPALPARRTRSGVARLAREAPAPSTAQVPVLPVEVHSESAGDSEAGGGAVLPSVSTFEQLQANTIPSVGTLPERGAQAEAREGNNVWQSMAGGGVRLGSASKASGLAVAGFFTRAGRSIAGAF